MTREQANAIGRDMLKKLGGTWKLEIHENIGWHASCNNGYLTVSVSPDLQHNKHTYFCLMTDDYKNYKNCGNPVWSERANGPIYYDPVDAVIGQVQHARKVVDKLNAALTAAEEVTAKFVCTCCGKKRI